MTVASVTVNAAPRLFRRHQRYAHFDRLNHSPQEIAWLETQANRLSTTTAIVFGKLNTYTSDQIVLAANLAALP
jgi:hypothetical protein